MEKCSISLVSEMWGVLTLFTDQEYTSQKH